MVEKKSDRRFDLIGIVGRATVNPKKAAGYIYTRRSGSSDPWVIVTNIETDTRADSELYVRRQAKRYKSQTESKGAVVKWLGVKTTSKASEDFRGVLPK